MDSVDFLIIKWFSPAPENIQHFARRASSLNQMYLDKTPKNETNLALGGLILAMPWNYIIKYWWVCSRFKMQVARSWSVRKNRVSPLLTSEGVNVQKWHLNGLPFAMGIFIVDILRKQTDGNKWMAHDEKREFKQLNQQNTSISKKHLNSVTQSVRVMVDFATNRKPVCPFFWSKSFLAFQVGINE